MSKLKKEFRLVGKKEEFEYNNWKFQKRTSSDGKSTYFKKPVVCIAWFDSNKTEFESTLRVKNNF